MSKYNERKKTKTDKALNNAISRVLNFTWADPPKNKKKKETVEEQYHKKPELTVIESENKLVKTLYTVSGTTVLLSNDADRPPSVDKLPLGTYTLSFHPDIGYYLTSREKFELPSKIYGNTVSRAARFLTTFEDRPYTTGVLLAGEKGSGKSLELKATCVFGLTRGISTIVVNFPACGDAFNKFIQSIQDPCIVVFDEFEKVYEDDKQEALLTLLDGTFSSKKLCIFTCNETNKINNHMINRPGRLFYYIKYTGLDQAFIREYCEDRLDNKTNVDNVVRATSFFGSFNFDMLQSLVEELNRYPNETIKDALSILNIKMDYRAKTYYDVRLFENDIEIKKEQIDDTSVCNPLYEEVVEINWCIADMNDRAEREKDDNWKNVAFDLKNSETRISKDMKEIVATQGEYRLVLKQPELKTYMQGSHFYGAGD